MADQIKKLSAGHTAEVLDGIMSEVEEARGEYDNLGERLDEMSSDTPTPSTAAPAMDGTAAAGTSTDYARADHIHPSDTSKQDTLTAAQLAAANSGIDSEKVEQIETNKNNILSVADQLAACQFLVDIADKAAYTFTFPTPHTSTNRYRFGLIMAGVSAAGTSLFAIFADTNNNVTINKIAGTTSRTFSGTISYSGDNCTLTIRPNDTQYGGIRVIWFD